MSSYTTDSMYAVTNGGTQTYNSAKDTHQERMFSLLNYFIHKIPGTLKKVPLNGYDSGLAPVVVAATSITTASVTTSWRRNFVNKQICINKQTFIF